MKSGETGGSATWVMLTYSLPREPSTPRIAVWRQLKRLGVAQLADGLVALPHDARTREHLEWVAQSVEEAGGRAAVWLASPAWAGEHRRLAEDLAAARAVEYDRVHDDALLAQSLSDEDRTRALTSLRKELRAIRRRDYFPPAARERAVAAVEALAPPRAAEADALEAGAVEGMSR